ncbi:MAG: ATP-binding protein [Polyangiaceae bacterium]
MKSDPLRARSSGPHRRGGRVLIVDDNQDLVGTLCDVLAPQGFVVVTASRGDEALEIARADGFDVAIVDVKLPDASGVDLIEPLRDAAALSEVVLITGFASVDAAIAALRSGAFAFVLKSFSPEELISTVEQAMTKVRLKREREELERRYRALVELTDVLVVALDEKNGVVFFNRRAAKMAGVPSAQAHGRSFVDTWIPAEDHVKIAEAIAKTRRENAARTGAGLTEVETGFTDTNAGGHRRIRWHLSGASEEEDARDLVYGIGIDVTERRALERRAADAEALSAMGTLAMNLAHEIRNPLNAAVLQLHLLVRDVDKLDIDDSVRSGMHHRADIVGSEIGRLNRLLTEFLDLARPRGISREPVHIATLLDEVLDLERDAAERSGIVIEKQLDEGSCSAVGDREKLKQVFINLVVNSIEAMKEGGTLTAKLGCEEGNVVVEIGDTGAGIPREMQSSIFDPFFTTKPAGTGLGLSIVRKIVDQHMGDVSIESEKGKGTRVRVRIPSR